MTSRKFLPALELGFSFVIRVGNTVIRGHSGQSCARHRARVWRAAPIVIMVTKEPSAVIDFTGCHVSNGKRLSALV